MIRLIAVAFFCQIGLFLNAQELFINEFMASNDDFLFDEDGDDSDWMEIYNAGDSSVNLSSFFLSDDEDDMQKWEFPDTVIAPGDFILVFASGKDRSVSGHELHTNFSIKADGESLFLCYEGALVHGLSSYPLPRNVSRGFRSDGTLPLVNFSHASPGGTNQDGEILRSVEFSRPGGFYEASFYLSADHPFDENAFIRYTTDGSDPDGNSPVFPDSLFMDESLFSDACIYKIQNCPASIFYSAGENDVNRIIVLKAAAFSDEGEQISEFNTQSYIIEELSGGHYDLPVVSVCGEQDEFFDNETGILVPGIHFNENDPDWTGNYYQHGDEWERCVSFEMYGEPGLKLNQNAGLRTHGGNGRRFQQKGLKLYARGEYGDNDFSGRLFPQSSVSSYQRLVLKPFASSWSYAGFEDYIANRLAADCRVDAMSTRPVILYLNGEYWGLYYLQERADEHYVEDHYGIDKDSLDVIGNWPGVVVSGGNSAFLDMMDYVKDHDLSEPGAYQYVCALVDIDNFIDYQILELFIGNYDWPANNMRCWRETKESAKWRWIFYDGDAGFSNPANDAFENALNTSDDLWPSNRESTLLFRKLLENREFHDRFFTRMEQLLKLEFRADQTLDYYKTALNDVYGESDAMIQRFGIPVSNYDWTESVRGIYHFLVERPCKLANHSEDRFGVHIDHFACVEPEVSVRRLELYPNPVCGDFYVKVNAADAGLAVIRIQDVQGRTVLESSHVLVEGDNEIRMTSDRLPVGLLFINLISGRQAYAAKFIHLSR